LYGGAKSGRRHIGNRENPRSSENCLAGELLWVPLPSKLFRVAADHVSASASQRLRCTISSPWSTWSAMTRTRRRRAAPALAGYYRARRSCDIVQNAPLISARHARGVQPAAREPQRVERDAVVVGIGVAVAFGDGLPSHLQTFQVRGQQLSSRAPAARMSVRITGY